MHPSSILNMQKARNKIRLDKNLRVLDVGGRSLAVDKDRSYQPIFDDVAAEYSIADINAGVGVTHVMPSHYVLPFNNNYFDLIVSGQTLEHVANPFRSVTEMHRVLKPKGYIILIAPSSGPRHDALDCWRFMDDGFKAIAEEVNLTVIADWVDRKAEDERSRQWADHVFIGQKPLPKKRFL